MSFKESKEEPFSKKMLLETLEIMVIGSGKLLLQNIFLRNKISEYHFQKDLPNSTRKKYSDSLSKLQGIPLIVEKK